MNTRLIVITLVIGAIVQIAMVVAGHFIPVIKNNVFAIGGMAISLAAGLAYARLAAGAWGPSLIGGAVVGAVCALIGIGLSLVLKDVPPMVLVIGTVSSGVAGAIGGAIGKLMA